MFHFWRRKVNDVIIRFIWTQLRYLIWVSFVLKPPQTLESPFFHHSFIRPLGGLWGGKAIHPSIRAIFAQTLISFGALFGPVLIGIMLDKNRDTFPFSLRSYIQFPSTPARQYELAGYAMRGQWYWCLQGMTRDSDETAADPTSCLGIFTNFFNGFVNNKPLEDLGLESWRELENTKSSNALNWKLINLLALGNNNLFPRFGFRRNNERHWYRISIEYVNSKLC